MWLEEYIGGDKTVDLDRVWSYFDSAEWYAQTMLEGGEGSEGVFFALKDENLRQEVRETLADLREFRSLAEERLREPIETGGIGSAIDQDFDVVVRTGSEPDR